MSRYPLISSQNPVSRQKAVPCMTIRLTPQIISQLNRTLPPRISFCIKDRTLTIDDVKHPLQAFVEDSSLCEVYSLRSDRLVQVGNIEHKLIVQREVQGKNASSSTPKVSESGSAHSNPLAPRPTPTSQRAKRPRDATATNPVAKRAATSNNSTPRRPVNQSPMDLKPGSPERQPTPAPMSRSTKNILSLPLRDQVLHLLAIQPMSAAGIGRRLSQPTKNLAAILKAVWLLSQRLLVIYKSLIWPQIAHYEVPGRYRLRDDLMTTVRIDMWPYSDAEKSLVLKNIESSMPKISEVHLQEGPTDVASLSIEDDVVPEPSAKTPKSSSKRPSPQRSDVVPKEPSPQSSEPTPKRPSSQPCKRPLPQAAETPAKRPPPYPNAPAEKETSPPPPIESHEEYLSCRSRFEQMYPRYSAIDMRLKEIAAEFNSMAVKMDLTQCPPAERRKIQQQVKELYAQLKPEVDQLKSEFNTMHEEMSILKSRIRIYVDTVLTPI